MKDYHEPRNFSSDGNFNQVPAQVTPAMQPKMAQSLRNSPIGSMDVGRVAFLLTGILALSTLLRVVFLSDRSLWHGETFSVWVAQLDWGRFLTALSVEPYMMLYYVLLRFWLGLGDSEFVVRSLSVVFAVVTIPTVYALGVRLFGVKVGLLGALLLAVNAFHIMYAQNARSYSLLVFLMTTSSLFFVKSIEQPTRKHWAVYVLSSVLGVYSHSFGVLVLVAHGASLVFLPRRSVPWRGLLWSILSIGLLLLPAAVLLQTGGSERFTWISPPGLFAVARAFSALAGAGGPPLLVAYLICCLIPLVLAVRAKSSAATADEVWHYGFLLTWFLVPFILIFAISLIAPVFSVRYMIICLPAVVLLAAVGVASLRARWMFVGMTTVIVSLSMLGIVKYYKAPPDHEDWRAATRYVVSEGQRGDAALFYLREGVVAFEHYRRRFNGLPDRPAVVFPSPIESDYAVFFTHGVRKVPPEKALVDDLPSRHARVWLIVISMWEHSAGTQAIQESLENHYRMIKRTKFPALTVFLYTNSGNGTAGTKRRNRASMACTT